MSDENKKIQSSNKLRRLDIFLGLANFIVGVVLLCAWIYVWLFFKTGPNNKALAAGFIVDVGKILLVVQIPSLAVVFFIAIKGNFSRFFKAICISLVILGIGPTLAFICYVEYISYHL